MHGLLVAYQTLFIRDENYPTVISLTWWVICLLKIMIMMIKHSIAVHHDDHHDNDHDHGAALYLYGSLIKCKFSDRLRPRVKRTSACGTHVLNQYREWR